MRFSLSALQFGKELLEVKSETEEKALYKLVEQVLDRILCFAAPEPGKRRVVRHLLLLKKPDKIDILAARKLQLSGGIDAAHIAVQQ